MTEDEIDSVIYWLLVYDSDDRTTIVRFIMDLLKNDPDAIAYWRDFLKDRI